MNSNDKVFSVLGYFGFLFLVPLLAGKTEFTRYHANQGLVLFICEAILGVILGIVCAVTGWIPVVGAIVSGILWGIEGLVSLIFTIIGIVHAANGEMKPLPGIGQITIIK